MSRNLEYDIWKGYWQKDIWVYDREVFKLDWFAAEDHENCKSEENGFCGRENALAMWEYFQPVKVSCQPLFLVI